MIIRLDINSEEAIYIQLMNQIKYGVANGYLKANEKLPSVRGLASELGINMHTVAKAYNLLKDEGILVVNRSKGVLVSKDVMKRNNDDYLSILNKKINELVYESQVNGVGKDIIISMVEEVYKNLGEK